jgi:hypothetical protein
MQAELEKWIKKMLHYLFHCPTFWRVKPAFVCPCCQATYRCYFDGHDVNGKINVCSACARVADIGKEGGE